MSGNQPAKPTPVWLYIGTCDSHPLFTLSLACTSLATCVQTFPAYIIEIDLSAGVAAVPSAVAAADAAASGRAAKRPRTAPTGAAPAGLVSSVPRRLAAAASSAAARRVVPCAHEFLEHVLTLAAQCADDGISPSEIRLQLDTVRFAIYTEVQVR